MLIDGAHAILQVYDLQEYRPGAVLRKIWKNFEAQERNGDTWAPIVRGCALDHPAMPQQTACSLGERICCFDVKECPVTASSYLPKHNVQARHQSIACAQKVRISLVGGRAWWLVARRARNRRKALLLV